MNSPAHLFNITARSRAGVAITSVVALLLSSCGGSDDSSTSADATRPAELQHLELRLVNESASSAELDAQFVQKLYPPAGLSPWSGTGKRVFQTLVPARAADAELPGYNAEGATPQAPAMVVLEDAGKPRQLRVPGSYEAASFNQVVLRVAVPQEEEVTISFLAEGVERARSESISIAGDPLPQLVVFDLPVLRGVDGVLDELLIEGAGHTRGIMLLEVALAMSPLETFLPPTSAPPGLLHLGGEGFDKRHGVGLYAGAPAEVVFDAPADHSLAFSYAVPKALRLPGSHAKLFVSIESAGGESVETELPIATSKVTWRKAELPLDALGDGQKRALFELRDKAGTVAENANEVCAITELRVVRKSPAAQTVVLITSDTHRGDHIGALGADAPVRTPAIDALAARGVLFSDAYAASNTTNPSHTSLMTGLHVRDTRVLDNRSPLIGEARTLAEAFREAGYHTLAAVSVRHLMDDESGLGQGFDRMSGPLTAERTARETIVQVAQWLDELEGEPAFVWFHVFDAHSPYEPPASTDRRYYPGDRDPFDKSQRLQFNGKFLPVYLRGLTDVEFPYAQYRAEVDALDQELRRALEHPRLASAIVALTADHGESFGAHGIWWDHAGLYPDTLHVPLVLSWPGGPRGERCDDPVRQMDLGRTLLDLAGEQAISFEGADLRAALAPEVQEQTRYFVSKDGNSASILEDGWMLVLHLRDYQTTAMVSERKRHGVELYDLGSDPKAARECAGEHAEHTRELRAKLIDWLSRASLTGLASDGQATAEQRTRLAGLGYTGEGADEAARAGKWFDADCNCSRCAPFESK